MELYEEVNKELGTEYKSNFGIEWNRISRFQILSESFIEKYQNYLNWQYVSEFQKLSEEFLERFFDRIDWIRYFRPINNMLSISFIEKHKDRFLNISFFLIKYQILDENFIEKYLLKRTEDIKWVAKRQILSESFIERHKDRLHTNFIFAYQKISKNFISKYFNESYLIDLKKNILVQSDIGRDWFIAYIDLSYYCDNFNYYLFDSIKEHYKIVYKKLIKVKIYYKDLVKPRITKKFYIIREINLYKICGKKQRYEK